MQVWDVDILFEICHRLFSWQAGMGLALTNYAESFDQVTISSLTSFIHSNPNGFSLLPNRVGMELGMLNLSRKVSLFFIRECSTATWAKSVDFQDLLLNSILYINFLHGTILIMTESYSFLQQCYEKYSDSISQK